MKTTTKKNRVSPEGTQRLPDNHSQTRSIEVATEVRKWKLQVSDNGLTAAFKELEKPNTVVSLFWIARNLLLLVICAGLFYWNPLTSLLTAPFTARAIRALGNQVHDASHRNIFDLRSGIRNWNNVIGEWLLGPVMLYDFNSYIKGHMKHHGGLATLGLDPDILCYPVHINDDDSILIAFWKVYKPLLLDKQIWMKSLFGDLGGMSKAALLRTTIFWAGLGGTIAFLFGPTAIVSVVLYYFLNRASFYHAVKCFAELSDHPHRDEPNLKAPITMAAYTRTLPTTWVSWFLYPENDGWHLLHHVNPGVPMPNLGRVHNLMLQISEYQAAASKYDSFFTGPKSLIKDLIGRYPSTL
ncbi:fatty acid desaturase [Spirosoma sp. BT702]|uniref:Fatty acid desaturase n=1 Tax=Spirosoma profusum TaxID=2771354 RepID=A0A927G9S8_9BACT|nr:fatty acid desaturase [Spirosoma profusum]MBD2704931.1 fatty acid desaturase [Spirosoma profusum]